MADLAELATRSGLHSVDNALRVLLLFRNRESLGVAETARALGVGRATAHRLVTTMVAHEFLVQDPSTRLYRAGPALCDIATAIEGTTDGRSQARPYLDELADELGETVTLVVLRGASALVLETMQGHREPAVEVATGSSHPAHLTAEGRALLAQLPAHRLRDVQPDTPEAQRSLQRALADARQKHYAVSFDRGTRATTVAVTIGGFVAGERVALGVSADGSRIRGAEDVAYLAEAAAATARRMTRDIGIPQQPAL